MSCRILAAALAVGVIAVPAAAAPSLHVTHVAINSGGNLDWTVGVAPDPALFSDSQQGFGGSLAVELAFEVSGTDLIGAVANAAQRKRPRPRVSKDGKEQVVMSSGSGPKVKGRGAESRSSRLEKRGEFFA